MNAYCQCCKKRSDITVKTEKEMIEINHVKFAAIQKHAFCISCGSEIYPDEIFTENVEAANDAYREAIGSISVAGIRLLLETYNIGANPLSKLLGWGENTIERQMKHTVPEPEKAAILKRLFDPYNMLNLVLRNGSTLTDTANKKLLEAVILRMERLHTAAATSEAPVYALLRTEKRLCGGSITIDDTEQPVTPVYAQKCANAFRTNPYDSDFAA